MGGSRLQRAYEQLAAELGEARPRRRQPTVWPDFSPWAVRKPSLAPDVAGDEVESEALTEDVPEWLSPVVGDVGYSPQVQKLLRQIRAFEREISAVEELEVRRRRDEEDFLMLLFLSE